MEKNVTLVVLSDSIELARFPSIEHGLELA